MAKKYTDELADWIKQREGKGATKRKDKNVVAFLAVRGDVQEAMAAGYSLKTIWGHLNETGKIPCRYETFIKHVRRFIKDVEGRSNKKTVLPDSESGSADDKNANVVAEKPVKSPKKTDPPSVSGFSFNAEPNKEDLF